MMNILFVVIHDGIGGIEQSFSNLIDELSNDKNLSIDILYFCKTGNRDMTGFDHVHVYDENKRLSIVAKTQKEVFAMSKGLSLLRLFCGFICKYISQGLGYSILMKDISIDKKYDIAISYNHSKANSLYGGTNEFVLEHVRADKKYAFIHGDLLLANLDSKYSHKIYKKFDKVVCVSKSCKKIFDETWNDLRSKSVVVYNGVNVRRILMEAGEGFAVNKEVINFITAARLDKVKAIKRTIQAFKYVKDRGLINFKWYIVGNGKELDEDIRYSKELGVDDWIVFLGEKKNPFYYMKNMDALLVLSYQEAAPMVFYEANVLGIPIVSTNTRSAKELVEEKGNGIVCENNLASIVDTLTRLVKNPDILRRIRRNVVKKVDNRESTDSFYRLLDTAYSDDAT